MDAMIQVSVLRGDPVIEIDVLGLTKKIATFCKNNGITNDAGWNTFITTRFSAANASGLSAGTRTFMIEFFDKLVKISPGTPAP